MKLGIGIDTGGTCTDAVVYDFTNRAILASAKALTTRPDLSVGIVNALDALPAGLVAGAELISLSTTLATNACVENRLGRGKLFFLGGDAVTVDRYGADYGLPPSEEVYLQESHTTFSGGFEREFDWERLSAGAHGLPDGLDGIGVVEMNAMRNGAVIETGAREILEAMTGVRVVCGHELSSELSCLQRCAGTLLNASLFPVINRFVTAVGNALARRGITAPVVIIRSDGSMMGEEFAGLRPVETLLCGPAASVIGALELSRRQNCVIIDIGGTTTDIAVVNSGEPVRSDEGIAIGKWRTFVKGIYIHTIGLGGDSAVHHRDGDLLLEEYRVVPLCIAASSHPDVIRQLEEGLAGVEKHTRPLHEFYILHRDISGDSRYTDQERRFCDALADGPLIRRNAAAAVGRDEYTLDMDRLVKDGVVQICGLTPTDIMHLRNDFTKYDARASRLAAGFVAANLDIGVGELGERVYRLIKKKLYLNIVEAMLRVRDAGYRNGVPEDVRTLIGKAFDSAFDNAAGLIAPFFRTGHSLVGIGAPTRLFLGDVARMLGAEAYLPEHADVANAVGAIVGKVHVDCEVLVRPLPGEGLDRFATYSGDEKRVFHTREEAERHAGGEAERQAREEAVRRGADGDVTVSITVDVRKAETGEGAVYLGSKVTARAVGSPRL